MLTNRRKWINLLVTISLSVIILIVTFAIFETILVSGKLDGLDNPNPVWIPPKYMSLQVFKRFAFNMASAHPFSFRDDSFQLKDNSNEKRIVVMGDSFIFNYSLPYNRIWSIQLRKRINDKYDNVRLLSWGRPSWSTLDQYEFLVKYINTYKENHGIDFLIIGWVNNDSNLNLVPPKVFVWQDSILIKQLNKIFPLTVDFISTYINSFLRQYIYKHLSSGPSTQVLLNKYKVLLSDFIRYCKIYNIKVLFVITPWSPNPKEERFYRKIIPVFEEVGVRYLNLYPFVKEEFKGRNERTLWALPADKHPGSEMNEFFADKVYDYLEKHDLLSFNSSGYYPTEQTLKEDIDHYHYSLSKYLAQRKFYNEMLYLKGKAWINNVTLNENDYKVGMKQREDDFYDSIKNGLKTSETKIQRAKTLQMP